MNFALSDEQQMLQESAQRFFTERHPLAQARQALPWSDELQRKLWSDMAGMGWQGLLASEARGGLELGMCEAFLVAEAAGRQLLNLPFAASAVLLPLLLQKSDAPPGLLTEWVEAVVEGRAAVNVGFEDQPYQEYDQQCSHQLLLAGLQDKGGDLRLRQLSASHACSVTAQDAPGTQLDPTLRCARVLTSSGFDTAAASPDIVLQLSPDDRRFVLACYRMARVGEMLGAAHASLDMTCDYARQREQFGQAIGSYQAIKHQLSNAWMALDNARLAALYAVAALDAMLPDWAFACSAAEMTAIEGSLLVGRTAIQVHGGMGFSWEHDAHLYLKRIHHVSALLGGLDAACERVAQTHLALPA